MQHKPTIVIGNLGRYSNIRCCRIRLNTSTRSLTKIPSLAALAIQLGINTEVFQITNLSSSEDMEIPIKEKRNSFKTFLASKNHYKNYTKRK